MDKKVYEFYDIYDKISDIKINSNDSGFSFELICILKTIEEIPQGVGFYACKVTKV